MVKDNSKKKDEILHGTRKLSNIKFIFDMNDWKCNKKR